MSPHGPLLVPNIFIVAMRKSPVVQAPYAIETPVREDPETDRYQKINEDESRGDDPGLHPQISRRRAQMRIAMRMMYRISKKA